MNSFGIAFIFLHVISGSMAQDNTTTENSTTAMPGNTTLVTVTTAVDETTMTPTGIQVVSTLATDTTQSATASVTVSTTTTTTADNHSFATGTTSVTSVSVVLNRTTSLPIIQLNVTSIIETISKSNRSQDIVENYNMTEQMFFTKVADYTLAQSDETVNNFLNTTTGQLLVELLEADSSIILGNFSNTISATSRRVFFYALLLDFEDNVENEEFVEIFINEIVAEPSTGEYSLDEERLKSRACSEFITAGGENPSCVTSTVSPASEINLGLIIGCSVAGAVLCLVIISIGIACLCKDQSSSKVSPSQNGVELENEQFNENGMQSQISIDNNYDTDT